MAKLNLGEWTIDEGTNTISFTTSETDPGTIEFTNANLDIAGNKLQNAGLVNASKLQTDSLSFGKGQVEALETFYGQTSGSETHKIHTVSDFNHGTTVLYIVCVAGANNTDYSGYYEEMAVFHDGVPTFTTTTINSGGDIDTANTGASYNKPDISFTFDAGSMAYGPYHIMVHKLER